MIHTAGSDYQLRGQDSLKRSVCIDSGLSNINLCPLEVASLGRPEILVLKRGNERLM